MRAAIYARYSSDNQREASIEDQVRICKARIKQEGWTPVEVYADSAVSGASVLRRGYQKLLEDARAGSFDIVVAEALDRLSRDLSDVASLYKQLSFLGVRLLTIAEGEISELHVGLKGTMNALYLKDLALKTHRGIEGRVRQGRSGGGRCYGYDVVREVDANGLPVRGGRSVNLAEAAVVRRVFAEFAAGRSPRAIAHALNAEGIPGPAGGTWGPSTIFGNWRRGTGILNNELYVGRLVWNRQRFVKDPQTGKRQARPNPESAWIIEEVPALRIVDDDLWNRVKAQQQTVRRVVAQERHRGMRPERARRPRYLLSGLLKCGECGGGFGKVSQHHYGCSNARNRGKSVCTNMQVIRRSTIEELVLEGLRTRLMAPDLVKEFIADFHREMNRLMGDEDAEKGRRKRELQSVNRDIRRVIEAIKAGMFHPAMKGEMDALEARKQELEAAVNAASPPRPRLHPNLAEVYRKKVTALQEALNDDDIRQEATEIIRSLIDEVRLVPDGDHLAIELRGDLAAIMSFANKEKYPRRGQAEGVQVTLVAGACNRLNLLLAAEDLPRVPPILPQRSYERVGC